MSTTRVILHCVAVGLLLRAGLVALAAWEPSLTVLGEQAGFHLLAGELSRQWSFSAWFGVERMPVYPTFLAVCNMLTGLSVQGAELPARTQVVALIVQVAFSLLAVFVMYRAGALYSRTVGLMAAVFAALNLNSALYGARLQAEALVFPFMALALYVFLLYRRTGGAVRLAALAAVLGLAALTAPVLMYIPVAVVPYLLLEWGRGGPGARIKRAAVFCLVFGVFLLPWLGRNLYYFGQAGVYGLDEANVVERVVPGVLEADEGLSPDEARDKARRLWRERLDAAGLGGGRAAHGLVISGAVSAERLPEGSALSEGALPGGPLEEAPRIAGLVRGFLWDVLAGADPLAVASAWGRGALQTLFAPAVSEVGFLYGIEHRPLAMSEGATWPERIGAYLTRNATSWLPALVVVGALATLLMRLVQLAGLGVVARHWPGNMLAVLILVLYILVLGGPAGCVALRLSLEPALAMLAARGVALLPSLRARDAGAGDGM